MRLKWAFRFKHPTEDQLESVGLRRLPVIQFRRFRSDRNLPFSVSNSSGSFSAHKFESLHGHLFLVMPKWAACQAGQYVRIWTRPAIKGRFESGGSFFLRVRNTSLRPRTKCFLTAFRRAGAGTGPSPRSPLTYSKTCSGRCTRSSRPSRRPCRTPGARPANLEAGRGPGHGASSRERRSWVQIPPETRCGCGRAAG
jgi:hypothetical protein